MQQFIITCQPPNSMRLRYVQSYRKIGHHVALTMHERFAEKFNNRQALSLAQILREAWPLDVWVVIEATTE